MSTRDGGRSTTTVMYGFKKSGICWTPTGSATGPATSHRSIPAIGISPKPDSRLNSTDADSLIFNAKSDCDKQETMPETAKEDGASPCRIKSIIYILARYLKRAGFSSALFISPVLFAFRNFCFLLQNSIAETTGTLDISYRN